MYDHDEKYRINRNQVHWHGATLITTGMDSYEEVEGGSEISR